MFLYRVLISLFALAVLVRLLVKGQLGAVRQRLGGGPRADADADTARIWLHAASNGELASARPVIDALREKRPDMAWVVTCNSTTGVALASSWGLPATLAPLDLRWTVDRFCTRWTPCLHITMESEIWPNRLHAMPAPVALLGARFSASTARTWGRFPRLARACLGRIALASPQDPDSLERLKALGLPQAACQRVLDLKAYYRAPGIAPDAALTEAFDRSRTWAAVSTHPGEDEILLEAHEQARRTDPDLKLILVPRHPTRGDALARLLAAKGWDFARRSTGDAPRGSVYLADTMGETALWYQLAGRVFVGGSLVLKGGHTPYEPAAFSCAILHGPDMRNFAAACLQLHIQHGSLQVEDAETLAAALAKLRPAKAQQAVGRMAHAALGQTGDLDALVDQCAALLPQPS